MTSNLFVIANVKQLRTGGSFRILLPFLPNISGVPRNFVRGGGVSTNSVEDRQNGDLGAVAP
jgi:hypothetical protein